MIYDPAYHTSFRRGMDQNAVFIKTEAGEDAVVRRTIVQRNLRSVLIMVDGKTPVANLAEQFGDPVIVQGLVEELEHRGLIRRLDEENRDQAHAEFDSALVEIEDLISQPIVPVADDIRKAYQRSSSEPPRESSPVLDEFAMTLPDLSAPVAETSVAAAVQPEREDVKAAIRRAMAQARSAGAHESTASGTWPKLLAMLRLSKAKPVQEGEAVDLPPIVRQAPRRHMSGWKKMFLGVLGSIALMFALFFAYPYSRHLPEIEKLASDLMGQPVRIARVSPSLVPEPSIALEDMSVGAKGELRISVVKLIPVLSSLFSERKVLRDLRIEQAGLDAAFLPSLTRRQDISWASRWIKVEKVSVVDSSLILLDASLGGLNGTLGITDDGLLTSVDLQAAAGGVKLKGTAGEGNWKLVFTATSWELPLERPVLLDVVEATALLTSTRLMLDKLDVKLLDGYTEGQLALDWADGDSVLSGHVQGSRLALASIAKWLAPELQVSGDLSFGVDVHASGVSLDALGKNLRADGEMKAVRGSIERVDLVQAVRSPRSTGSRGGSTKFDALAATVQISEGTLRLQGAQLESGLLTAAGRLNLGAGKLDGVFDVALHGSAATVRGQVAVTGPMKDPVLMLAR